MPSIAGLLGAAVEIGAELTGIVRAVLVDAARSPVLLRVELPPDGRTVYIPRAALACGTDAAILRTEPYVVLGVAEVAFYVGHGFEWVSRDEVSAAVVPGIVAP